MSADAADLTDLVDWLHLADEVSRRHRQGQALGTDPTLVLRGLPPMWRPAARSGGPGDDVVALAGAALDLVDAADAELRPALVEAAAGCLGSDLPALLRQVRPVIAGRMVPAGDPSGAGADRPGDVGQAAGSASEAGPAQQRPRPGRRLAVAGGVGAAVLAVLGTLGARAPERPPGAEGPPASAPVGAVALSVGPTAVDGRPDAASVAWRPPHLVVHVGGTRYRYRIEGPVDEVALSPGGGSDTVVVTSGRQRWEVAIPALDATRPGPTGS